MKYTPFDKLIRTTNCEHIVTVEGSGNPSTPDTSYTSQPKGGPMSQSCKNGVRNNIFILFASFETLNCQTGRKIQTIKSSLSTEFVSDKLERENIVKFWSLTKRQLSDEEWSQTDKKLGFIHTYREAHGMKVHLQNVTKLFGWQM
jgi:hypothetical protein